MRVAVADSDQQPIASLVAERVIDVLEVIEIEAMHGDAGRRVRPKQRFAQLFKSMKRFGSSVRWSWWARWLISSSAAIRSVASTTVPS